MADGEFDWLRGTYWFVPAEGLPAILASNGRQPRVREVTDQTERERLWKLAVAAYPPYAEYQARTTRQIPLFVATP